MAKSANCCLVGAALIASLALNVALMSGCVIDTNPPFFHLKSEIVEDHSQCKARLNQEREESFKGLCKIADEIGLEVKTNDDAVSLRGEILQRLKDAKVSLPSGELGEDDFKRINERLLTNTTSVKDACQFVMNLKGKKVLVLEGDK